MAEGYDLVVIGSGTGGYVAALRAAQLGVKTALVERQPVLGGTCLNWGCIPTKALLEHAHALRIAQHAAEWGIRLDGAAAPVIDMARVHERKDAIVAGLVKGIAFLCRKNQVDVVKGTGRFASPGLVEVVDGTSSRALSAREVIIATGSAPRVLPGIPVDGQQVITSDEAIHLASVPASIAIIGGGAVGVEFASIFRQFGSRVTLIELQPRLVPTEDAAVSSLLERAFRKRGITVRTGTAVHSVDASRGGVSVVLRTGEAEDRIEVERLLVAIGRRPVTNGLGTEKIGLSMDDGYIRVDEWCRTSVAGVSAIGDVIAIPGRRHPQLAHVSSAEGIFVAERIAGRDPAPLEYDHVPATTYCEPEIGSVGLTEAEAQARGLTVRVGTFPFSALGRAKIAGDTDGFVKIVADAEYDQVLGVHIIGPRATELVGEAVMAIRLESTSEEFARAVHAHPTMSEAIGEAAHALHGGAIHV